MVKYWDRKTEEVLDVLGESMKRKMVERLVKGGTMSVSKMVEPFDITLPAAMKHVYALETAGIIRTHKRGRVRFCVFNIHAFEPLIDWLTSQTIFWQGSFDRLERTLLNNKKSKK